MPTLIQPEAMDGRWRFWTAVASAARHRFGDRSAGGSSKPKRRRRCARSCSLHGSLATGVAERLDDGSRGLQPTVARGENPRRGATLERPHLPTIQASLRDADPLGPPPWAEAHGYSRSSLRDEAKSALHDRCKEQDKSPRSKVCGGTRATRVRQVCLAFSPRKQRNPAYLIAK